MKNYIRPINYLDDEDIFSRRQYSDTANLIWLRNTIKYNPLIYERLIYDCLESGVLKVKNDNSYLLSQQTVEAIKGLIFESLLVDLANNYENIKKELYLQATKKAKVSEKYLNQYTIIGTGLLSTNEQYPWFYNPGDSKDALFIRPNKKVKRVEPATIKNSTNIAAIQIKAIRSENSLNKNVIRKKIINRYDGIIITCLMYDQFLHTKEKCIDIISNMKEEIKITIDGKKYSLNKEIRNDVISSLVSPEDICIDQGFINYYEAFIDQWFKGVSGLSSDKMYGNIETALILLNEKIRGNSIDFVFKVEDLYQPISFG